MGVEKHDETGDPTVHLEGRGRRQTHYTYLHYFLFKYQDPLSFMQAPIFLVILRLYSLLEARGDFLNAITRVSIDIVVVRSEADPSREPRDVSG